MQLQIVHQVDVLTNPLKITCLSNCPDCQAATKTQQFLDPKCLPHIWIPARHMTTARMASGNVNHKKAMTSFLKELDLL